MSTSEPPDRPSPISTIAGENAVTVAAAGPIRRFIATLLDMAILGSVSLLLVLPAIRVVDWDTALRGVDELTQIVSRPATIDHFSSVLGMWIALWWCYFIVGWGLLGATPGKWLAGLKIVDHRGRSPIGASRALLRLLAYMVSSATLGVGHSLMLFRSDHRTLHDILAGTRVVRRPRRRPTQR